MSPWRPRVHLSPDGRGSYTESFDLCHPNKLCREQLTRGPSYQAIQIFSKGSCIGTYSWVLITVSPLINASKSSPYLDQAQYTYTYITGYRLTPGPHICYFRGNPVHYHATSAIASRPHFLLARMNRPILPHQSPHPEYAGENSLTPVRFPIANNQRFSALANQTRSYPHSATAQTTVSIMIVFVV